MKAYQFILQGPKKNTAKWNYKKNGFLFFPRFSILVHGHPKPFVGVAVSYCYVFISLSPRQQVFYFKLLIYQISRFATVMPRFLGKGGSG